MGTYAIIRESVWHQPYEEQPPAYVMLVERETDASLMGSILGPEGQVEDWLRAFDTAPSYDITGWGRDRQRTRTKPGRVRKERLLTRHDSFAEAAAALSAAREAWWAAEDEDRYRAVSRDWQAANNAYEAEKKRLEAEMREHLADALRAKDEATKRLHLAKADIFAKQTEAAIAAAERSSDPSALPCHAGELER